MLSLVDILLAVLLAVVKLQPQLGRQQSFLVSIRRRLVYSGMGRFSVNARTNCTGGEP